MSEVTNDSILFAKKASELLDDGKVDDALKLCEVGVRNFPFYATGHYVMALCYENLDNWDEAKNEFERTLVYDPAHAGAMRKMYTFYNYWDI